VGFSLRHRTAASPIPLLGTHCGIVLFRLSVAQAILPVPTNRHRALALLGAFRDIVLFAGAVAVVFALHTSGLPLHDKPTTSGLKT
jgi:hypothetical protein